MGTATPSSRGETSTPTGRLTLAIDTIGQLGQYLSPRSTGLVLSSPGPLEAGTPVDVEISIGAPLARRLDLEGRVSERLDAAGQVRVELDEESWRRLFVCVCRTPWRRRADLEPRPGDDRRWRLSERAMCYVPRTGQRHDATLLEVSERGAFLGIDAIQVESGEEVRFRGRHDMAWHSAQVRWHGVKDRHPGVGVEIEFGDPADRSRWLTWLSFAERRSA